MEIKGRVSLLADTHCVRAVFDTGLTLSRFTLNDFNPFQKLTQPVDYGRMMAWVIGQRMRAVIAVTVQHDTVTARLGSLHDMTGALGELMTTCEAVLGMATPWMVGEIDGKLAARFGPCNNDLAVLTSGRGVTEALIAASFHPMYTRPDLQAVLLQNSMSDTRAAKRLTWFLANSVASRGLDFTWVR